MKHTYLEVTYRTGRAVAAYYYLPRRDGDKVVRTEHTEGGLLVDYTNDGRAIGIEIKSPARFVLADLNRVLKRLGHGAVAKEEVAPLCRGMSAGGRSDSPGRRAALRGSGRSRSSGQVGRRVCDFCGRRGARLRRVTRSYGRGAGEFLVRNIPTISCPHCGETYLTAATLHELEQIKTRHRRLAVKKRVAVADFLGGSRRRAS